ncbi:recombinase family protein [Acutalibacter sp. 1XD8-33]|uniref:recombinase family protein n=1 Tax=Acutalibacter sp. 1XD8-33 TaxID=2320081 RepID=UPI00242E952A|nr:recombinase family protein [Acutalibacter sp. 1XD8-33]
MTLPNGTITTHPQEVTVLNRIFSEYQNGLSLLDIANRLNDENVQYQPGATGWNKSRIMRLIKDDRYTGKGGFPAIIDEETHKP